MKQTKNDYVVLNLNGEILTVDIVFKHRGIVHLFEADIAIREGK